MKYTLINCYSDNNKGDSGIILSTVELLLEHDKDADIVGVSTYNQSDPAFELEHEFLRQKIKVFPSVFGELNIYKYKGVIVKNLRLLLDVIRLTIFLLLSFKNTFFRRLLFSKAELLTIDRLEESDYVISKGGSFICNEDNFREKLGLIRFLFIFFVSFKLKKKVIILCQSLGPIYGSFSRKIVNYVISKCYWVVLRESTCIDKYSYLDLIKPNVTVLNDIAFYLDTSYIKDKKIPLNNQQFNVGFTIKDVSPSLKQNYIKMMSEAIKFCIDEYDAFVHIFPHVTIDNDVEVSYEVHKVVEDRYKSKIAVYNQDYSAPELKKIYSGMDIFIGTRLHSTIFALGEMVPAICISYHGTKSFGIFSNYGLSKYAVEEYSDKDLILKIKDLVSNRENVRTGIKEKHDEYHEKFLKLFGEIFL